MVHKLVSVLLRDTPDRRHLFIVEEDTVALVRLGDHLWSEGGRDELGVRG